MRNFDYMKLAKTKWDMEIVSYIAKIHECKGRQDLNQWNWSSLWKSHGYKVRNPPIRKLLLGVRERDAL